LFSDNPPISVASLGDGASALLLVGVLDADQSCKTHVFRASKKNSHSSDFQVLEPVQGLQLACLVNTAVFDLEWRSLHENHQFDGRTVRQRELSQLLKSRQYPKA
jgi:hypothetical protein